MIVSGQHGGRHGLLDRHQWHLGQSGCLAADSSDLAGALSGAFVLFCVGAMTLLGCLRHGALADPDLLLVKATLDGVSSGGLAPLLGWGGR